VIEMGPAEIMEVFEIRTSLETQILRKILRNQMIKEAHFQKLTEIALEMKDGEERCRNEEDKVFLFNTLDLSFHRYIWQLSGSVRRAQILESLYYQLLIAMNEDLSSLGILEKKIGGTLGFCRGFTEKRTAIRGPRVPHAYSRLCQSYVAK
jgi:DNA-binding GntR family transcriptional regulator